MTKFVSSKCFVVASAIVVGVDGLRTILLTKAVNYVRPKRALSETGPRKRAKSETDTPKLKDMSTGQWFKEQFGHTNPEPYDGSPASVQSASAARNASCKHYVQTVVSDGGFAQRGHVVLAVVDVCPQTTRYFTVGLLPSVITYTSTLQDTVMPLVGMKGQVGGVDSSVTINTLTTRHPDPQNPSSTKRFRNTHNNGKKVWLYSGDDPRISGIIKQVDVDDSGNVSAKVDIVLMNDSAPKSRRSQNNTFSIDIEPSDYEDDWKVKAGSVVAMDSDGGQQNQVLQRLLGNSGIYVEYQIYEAGFTDADVSHLNLSLTTFKDALFQTANAKISYASQPFEITKKERKSFIRHTLNMSAQVRYSVAKGHIKKGLYRHCATFAQDLLNLATKDRLVFHFNADPKNKISNPSIEMKENMDPEGTRKLARSLSIEDVTVSVSDQ